MAEKPKRLELRWSRPPSWKSPEWQRKVFDEFADSWLHYFGQTLDLSGTPAIVLYGQFKRWCEETHESMPLLGRNLFYKQIERRYGPLGTRRCRNNGLLSYRSLRLRKTPKQPAEQTPLPMSDPRDEAPAEASGQEKERNPGIF